MTNNLDVAVQPIETRYAGCRFRSRLEARWACSSTRWAFRGSTSRRGFTLSDGRNYLPDFLLPECGTWIEVKGSTTNLDEMLIERAAADLPVMPYKSERGPQLMLLGPIPRPQPCGDYGWVALEAGGSYYWNGVGFGAYHKNGRPRWLDCAGISGDGLSVLDPLYCEDDATMRRPLTPLPAPLVSSTARTALPPGGHPQLRGDMCAPSANFRSYGDTVGGRIIEAPWKTEQTDLKGKPQSWDDGAPRLQLVVAVQTELRDPQVSGDDGKRRLFSRTPCAPPCSRP